MYVKKNMKKGTCIYHVYVEDIYVAEVLPIGLVLKQRKVSK